MMKFTIISFRHEALLIIHSYQLMQDVESSVVVIIANKLFLFQKKIHFFSKSNVNVIQFNFQHSF